MENTAALPQREHSPLPRTTSGNRSRLGLTILLEAVMLGVLGNWLLEVPPGIGIPLWLGALLLAGATLSRRNWIPLQGGGRWMCIPVLLFAMAMVWRGSEGLAFLNLLAVLVALGVGAWRVRGGRLRAAGIGEYLRGVILAGLETGIGFLLLSFEDVRWNDVSDRRKVQWAGAVMRGLLIAIPLLVLFGSLFASADPVFNQLVERLFGWNSGHLLTSLVWIAVWTWLSAGYLRYALLSDRAMEARVGSLLGNPETAGAPRRAAWLGQIESTLVLGLLNVLFLAFVLVQFRYLFGGEALVRETLGLSYAEYARGGFFQLVVVAALVLPVLLGLDSLVHSKEAQRSRLFSTLAGSLIVLLLVILASAEQRMRLYYTAYGLTESRFYVVAFMGWLAAVLVWLCATVLRGRRERFPLGAVVAGFTAVAGLNLVSPEAVIAGTNLQRAQQTGAELDARYLARLGPDATPALLRALPHLPPLEACIIASNLLGDLPGPRRMDEGWASWNWSRERAQRMLRDNRQLLESRSCENPGPSRVVQPAASTAGHPGQGVR